MLFFGGTHDVDICMMAGLCIAVGGTVALARGRSFFKALFFFGAVARLKKGRF
jgi:hypothetical protein